MRDSLHYFSLFFLGGRGWSVRLGSVDVGGFMPITGDGKKKNKREGFSKFNLATILYVY
jgi:hypothetical protein